MLMIQLLDLYALVLIIRVILSWVNPNPYNPVVSFLYRITEPVLDPVRRIIPPLGGLDLSPLVVLAAIWILTRLLIWIQ